MAPPIPTDKLRMPVKLAPLIVTGPDKLRFKSLPPPATVELKVAVDPVNVVPVPRVTPAVYAWLPVVVMPAALINVAPDADKLVTPVTSPPKTLLPLTARLLLLPFTVLPKIIVEPEKVALAPRATASLYVWMLLVMTLAALNIVVPPALMVRDDRGVILPIRPLNWEELPEWTVRLLLPSTLPLKVTIPVKPPSTVASLIKFTALLNVMAAPVVEILAPRSIPPGPVKDTGPLLVVTVAPEAMLTLLIKPAFADREIG